MKQGKTEKAVFAKLSTQKVEMASMKDLDKVTQALDTAKVRLNQEKDELAILMGKLQARADQAIKFVYKTDNMIMATESIIRELISQARELGIDPNDLKEIKEFNKEKDYVNGLMDDLRNLADKADKL
jgi:phage terminase small subunit